MDAVEATSEGLFALQKQVYDSRAKRVVIKAGRRGGKTEVAMPIAVRAAAKFPGSTIPVLELTLTSSAAISFWKALQNFDAKHKLGIDFKHTYKTATMPNGSRIQLYGCGTIELVDKLRGEPYPVVVGDELGTWRSHVAEYAVREVLPPSLMDYDGQLYLIGTPSPRREGFWFDRCHDTEWEQHHWTMLDNSKYGKLPYQHSLEWRQKELAEEIFRSKYLPREEYAHLSAVEIIAACDHPKFLREYMGQWVDHIEALMYEFAPARNVIDRMPEADPRRPWRYGLGIDLGFNDPTAFTVTASRERDPYIYVVESYQATHMIPSQCAAQIDRLKMQYGYFHFIVADTGGAGKLAVEEMNRKYSCGIIPAQKTAKLVYVEHLNGDLRTGRLQIVKATNQDLIADLYTLPWNEDRTDAGEGADHLPDSLLYNHRQWNVAREGWEFEAPRPGEAAYTRMILEAEEKLGDDLQAALTAGADEREDAFLSRFNLDDWG
jgi:hypothetical protein